MIEKADRFTGRMAQVFFWAILAGWVWAAIELFRTWLVLL